ncbi:MAG: SDR family oxidoreductase [Clostridia bacterium]|nr:SDR family oxidoreductase [Clostridia bacterium]
MGSVAFDFSKDVVVITGAASGIGRGTALQFAKAGASLAICDMNLEEAEKTAAQCREITSGKVIAVKMNVTNDDEVAAARDTIIKEMGTVDILFSNAGVSSKVMGPPLDIIPNSDWELVLQVNTLGMVKVCRAFAPVFREKRSGKIVLTSSIAAYTSTPRSMPYSVSKLATIGFAHAFSIEMGEYNVNVNTICPGFVYTNIYADGTAMKFRAALGGGLLKFNDNESVMNAMAAAGSSLKRAQKVEDMAYAVMFLCSEQAKEITGQVLNVDSGYVNRF